MTPLLAIALSAQDAPWAIGAAQLHRLDLLPALRRSIKVGAVTSYDRTEGNDDGFSGKYSFVRKEGEDLVLADLKGPGCIYRIHTPTATDDPLEFYFDGESTPRLKTTFKELYSGKLAGFPRPLVDVAGGGSVSYVPVPYKKSCKVLLRAKNFQFYDLNFATYPPDAPVSTFKPGPMNPSDLAAVKAVFAGGDLSKYTVPSGTKLKPVPVNANLAAGKSVTLFQTKTPGRIAGLRLGPSDAFAGKGRDIWLRVTWDGEKSPSIFCPVGDFFGYGWGKPAMGSCLVGTKDGFNYCNLPMPFDKSAKIELISASSLPISVRGEVVLGDTARTPYEAKFRAVWHRENPTTKGEPFTYIDTKGRGHIVGLALQAQGMEPGSTTFFEGDDQTTIDGELAVHGTGSEDFFNGGWYDVPDRWDGPLARPLSGCMAYQKPLGRSGAYRFFIGDAYSYTQSIRQTMEHAPERNEQLTDYTSVTYLYSTTPPSMISSIPPKVARQVVDPKRITFPVSWTIPINSFSFRDATLSRTSVTVDGQGVRCLSMKNVGDDWFGPPFISIVCDLPSAGKYKLSIDAIKGPAAGTVQLFRDELPVGDSVDLYNANPAVANGLVLGELSCAEGPNDIMFKITGKNPSSTGLGFDLVNIVLVKV